MPMFAVRTFGFEGEGKRAAFPACARNSSVVHFSLPLRFFHSPLSVLPSPANLAVIRES